MPNREGHAGPGLETPGGQVLGKWQYDYAIIPHRGTWEDAYQQAYAFETPLQSVETGLHEGKIQTQGSFITHTPAEFVISAVKEAEDGKGWLVRGYNISSETISLNLKPLRKFAHVAQVNLAEEKITERNTKEDGSVTFPVTGHQVVSILFSD